MSKQKMFRIIFMIQDTVYEVFANKIYESEMFGFIEVEDFVFGENNSVIVDPSVEKLKLEFDGVTRSYIPMQSILRIDELDSATGVGQKPSLGGHANVSTLPGVNLREFEKKD
ncbi:MAG: DUF1820 family protein [Legionellales bacterium]|nr:DUF1820 family protein [Legionellales bacterium]